MKDGQGNRGWLKPPTPEEGSLDVKKSRGSILARLFKDWMQDVGGEAPATMGKKKRFSRRDAKPPREEGDGGLTTKCTESTKREKKRGK